MNPIGTKNCVHCRDIMQTQHNTNSMPTANCGYVVSSQYTNNHFEPKFIIKEHDFISRPECTTVESPKTDTPRSGQPLYNGQTSWNGINLPRI